jgi:hypothetical protein
MTAALQALSELREGTRLTADAASMRGFARRNLKRPAADWIGDFETALELRRRLCAPSSDALLESLLLLARGYSDLDRTAEAEPLLLEVVRIVDAAPGASAMFRQLALEDLVRFYRAGNRMREAADCEAMLRK